SCAWSASLRFWFSMFEAMISSSVRSGRKVVIQVISGGRGWTRSLSGIITTISAKVAATDTPRMRQRYGFGRRHSWTRSSIAPRGEIRRQKLMAAKIGASRPDHHPARGHGSEIVDVDAAADIPVACLLARDVRAEGALELAVRIERRPSAERGVEPAAFAAQPLVSRG